MDFGPAISRLGIICYTPLLKKHFAQKERKKNSGGQAYHYIIA